MGRPRKVQTEGAQESGEQGEALARVRFSRVWSGERGYFAPGAVAELPAEIAESLLAEEVVEIVDEE